MSAGEPSKYAQVAAEMLIELSSELEHLGARLCADPGLVQDHMEALQAIDRIAQTQRSLAEVLSANRPELAVAELGLDRVRQKLLI